MIDLRDLPGGLVRHRNRCDPKPKRDGQIFVHEDGTVSIAYMTPAEAMKVWEVAGQSEHLHEMRAVLGDMLGIDEDGAHA